MICSQREYELQRSIQNPAKHLRWSVLRKQFTAKIRQLYLQNALVGWIAAFASIIETTNTTQQIVCQISGSTNFMESISLRHFMALFFFCTPWKHQKASGFLRFSGGIERPVVWNRLKLLVKTRFKWTWLVPDILIRFRT